MQLDDGRDQTETKTQSGRMAALVRSIEASRDDLALARADARSTVAHAHDAFASEVHQLELYAAALWRELHGVIDQIGDRLEQEVAVAAHHCFDVGSNFEGNVLVLGNRLVEVAHLAHDIRQGDLAEPFQAPALLDLGYSQQCRDDRQRLVESADGLINGGPQLLQRLRIGASPLQSDPHARERRAQLMRDVIAHAGNSMDQHFDLVEHAVDDDGKPVEWIVEALSRQAFAQFAGDNAPNSSVDLLHTILRPQAQEHSRDEAETQGWDKPHHQSALHDRRDLGELVDVATEHQDLAGSQPAGYRANCLRLMAPVINADNQHGLWGAVDHKLIRQALQVADDASAIDAKESRKPDAARILAQALVD